MLGTLTIADAIAFGTLIVGLLAAWWGRKSGDSANKITPPAPIIVSDQQLIISQLTRIADQLEELVEMRKADMHARLAAMERDRK